MQAERHFRRASDAADADRLDEAIREFEAAQKLFPSANVLYNLGVLYDAVGRPLDAARALERFVAELNMEAEPSLAPRLADARARLSVLDASLALVDVSLTPADAELRVDGETRSTAGRVRTRPGRHEVTVERPGFAPARRSVEWPAGVVTVFAETLERAKAEPISPAPPARTATPLTVSTLSPSRPADLGAGATSIAPVASPPARRWLYLAGGAALAAAAVAMIVWRNREPECSPSDRVLACF